MSCKLPLETCIASANTGLDAIKRAPIVEQDTGIRCLRIQDVSQVKSFEDWGFTDVTPANFKKFQLKKDDILIARTGGSIGVNRYIEEDLQSVYNNGLIR
ncbi:restriction endonuclease subunit S, partial [Vibrio parahaemolyticus]